MTSSRTPQWVIAAGGYRSGSTLQYNLLGIYLERLGLGRRVGYFEPDDLDSLPELEGLGMVKSHHVARGPMGFSNPEAWVPLVESGLAVPLSTQRDERERRASMARKFGIAEAAIDDDPRWIQDRLNESRWSRLGVFVQDYRSLVDEPERALRELADLLSLPWDQDAAGAAVEGSSVEAARALSANVAPGDWDPVSLLHRDHISGGAGGGPPGDRADARAQYGEDLLLAEHFAGRETGTYVEVGAHDGLQNSNTFLFERRGWTGVLVEPDPVTASDCAANRPGSRVVQAAAVGPGAPPEVTFERSELSDHSSLSLDRRHLRKLEDLTGSRSTESITVPAATLSTIAHEAGLDRIDFVTIDVEGHEMQVLEGFDLRRWRPDFVIVERNYLWPVPRLLAHMYRHGYRYLRTTGVNDWYVERTLDRACAGTRARRIARLLALAPGRQAYLAFKHRVKQALLRLRP